MKTRLKNTKKSTASRTDKAVVCNRRVRRPWTACSKKMPRQNQRVLAKYQGVYGPRLVTYWHDGVNAHFGDPATLASEPATHWRAA